MSTTPENLSKIQMVLELSLGFGLVTYKPGGRCGPRVQHDCQLVVIHRGEAVLTLDDRRIPLQEGEGILLSPGHREFFEFCATRRTTHSWCQIAREEIPASLMLPPDAFGRPMPCSQRFLRWMQNGAKAHATALPNRQFLASAVLMTMWEFAGTLAGATPPPPPALLQAREMIERRLGEPLTLELIATAAGLSPGHLTELAKRHWGHPPIAFLWRRRVEEGARLLRETGGSISEIAYQLGFANPFHFSRRFRAQFGCDPRSWRKAAWGQAEAKTEAISA